MRQHLTRPLSRAEWERAQETLAMARTQMEQVVRMSRPGAC